MFDEIDNESRKIFINTEQIYTEYGNAIREKKQFDFGMRWKRTGEKQYLFKTKGGLGYGKSLGVRSDETERIFKQFHVGKNANKDRIYELTEMLKKQSKFCIAAGINRVPKTAANIIRILDKNNVMGKSLMIVGTHALYAYEILAGLKISNELLATGDIDLLFDAKSKLKFHGNFSETGLIGLLKKIDISFELDKRFNFRATNKKGFMVELIKPSIKDHRIREKQQLTKKKDDFIAVEIDHLIWLKNSPKFRQTVISEDGYPVNFHVPDPRFFALYKIWMSQIESRIPIKRPRDLQQAKVVARIAKEYLNLDFNDRSLSVFPQTVNEFLGELFDDGNDTITPVGF